MKIFEHSPEQLATSLQWPADYELTIRKAKYHRFTLPKKDGSLRRITAPGKKLKFLQKTLANVLQLYYLERIPNCVHGYVAGIHPVVGQRHILSNARAHQGAAYLLNLDLDEFFPSIDSLRILDTLRRCFPKMPLATAELIASLTTRKNALPMGSPSSPVLSNLCLLPLDKALLQYCNAQGITYTRYVDDLSFSATQDLSAIEPELLGLIESHGFAINPSKRRYFGPKDTKLITGLILAGSEIRVQEALLVNLSRCIQSYERLQWLQQHLEADRKWLRYKVKSMEQSINGQLGFLQQILGSESATFQKYHQQFSGAQNQRPPSFDFYF